MPRSTRSSSVNGGTKAALAAVVETVRVAVPALAPVITTGLVEPKLKVAGPGHSSDWR